MWARIVLFDRGRESQTVLGFAMINRRSVDLFERRLFQDSRNMEESV